jgi:hypothetical protein
MLVPAGVPALAGLQSSFQGPTRADLKDNSDGPAKAGTPTSLPPSPIPIASAPAVSAPLWIEDGADAGKAGEGRRKDPELDTQEAADDERFPFFTAAQLNSGQFDTRYLIPGILAAAQPGGIYGAFKTLKTSLTADLLISLASGTPFLGKFPVTVPGRTLFLSGESGLAALQSIARRIAVARGLSLETLDNFELSPKLPNLDNADDLRALGRIVRRKKPVCVAIDPAYLAIRGEDARNLFAMGSLLRPLAELCDETGSAILIVHHCKRSRIIPGNPATLDDIAWSGFAEFSAQWLLLSRRRRFDPDTGRHELWFSTGDRAGHHGLWALDVDEGAPGDPNGRVWQPALRSAGDAEFQHDVNSAHEAESQRQLRTIATNARHRQRILELLREKPAGETPRYFREFLALTNDRTNAVLQALVEDGLIKTAPVLKRKRWEYGYKLVGGESIPAGNEK